MNDLFKKGNLDSINIVDLKDAVHRDVKRIQLPAFQRDAVWDERRVEILWDSIARGLPIGSMLFARSRESVDIKTSVMAGNGETMTRKPSEKTEFLIIDGQQRTNAIALGLTTWNEMHTARLWVDLGVPTTRANKEKYPFHMSSWRRPWGENANATLQKKALDDLELTKLPKREERLNVTWPLRAKIPVKFPELMNLLKSSGHPDWQSLVPKSIDLDDIHPREDFAEFINQLREILEYRVPLFLTEKSDINDLGLIFDRLNRQGVPLSAEDLFFSALKIKWPAAHDLVWQIYDDRETGRFMRPTKIVHLSTRLVAADREDSDLTSLNRVEFIRRFESSEENEDQQETSYLIDLQKLISELAPEHEVGRLTYYLRHARKALSYRTEHPSDPGLPSTLLRRLRWRVWHATTAWIATHSGEVDEFSRREMIRYALLDYFFTKSTSTKLVRFPFQAGHNADGTFPGKAIYQYLQENELLNPSAIFTPDEFRIAVAEAESAQWPKIQNEWHLIMWIQRSYFEDWFSDFDPSLYRKDADLPFHADHIIPRAHLNMAGMKNWDELPDLFKEWRRAVKGSAGNIRYWPKGLNISDSDHNLRFKHLLGPAKDPTPPEDPPKEGSYLRSFNLKSIGDVRKASFISETDVSDWEKASNGGKDGRRAKDWRDVERIKDFRKATDARRVAAYQQFFEQVGYDQWLVNNT